jgi:hypothetical protein
MRPQVCRQVSEHEERRDEVMLALGAVAAAWR